MIAMRREARNATPSLETMQVPHEQCSYDFSPQEAETLPLEALTYDTAAAMSNARVFV
jgi:hypothetical protein